eukprot:199645-Chlamydomonas_euryale.AAC.3
MHAACAGGNRERWKEGKRVRCRQAYPQVDGVDACARHMRSYIHWWDLPRILSFMPGSVPLGLTYTP